MSAPDQSSTVKPDAGPRRRIPVFALLPLVVFAALAVLFLFQMFFGRDPSELPSALLNKPAPRMELPAVEGLMDKGVPVPGIAAADLDGGVSVVNVFASWCVPCRQEHPVLEEMAKDGRFRMYGINYKDQPENARRFLGALGNPYDKVGADAGGRAAIEWGVYGVPETYVIDGKGVIRYKFIGPLSPESYERVFLPQLERVLAGGS
ncbi:DsbE family thiol:disulfide interchange protein [Pannonibacter indicus]|uniref:DsbE family thiol:disulfide interchange protein n=1 Tax=Pannonibacter indicus TaxID=466044 RepID=UPI0035AE27C9